MDKLLAEEVEEFINYIKEKDVSLLKNTDEQLDVFVAKFDKLTFIDLFSLFDGSDDDCEGEVIKFADQFRDDVIDNELVEVVIDVLLTTLQKLIKRYDKESANNTNEEEQQEQQEQEEVDKEQEQEEQEEQEDE